MKYTYKPQKKLLGSSTFKMQKSKGYKYLSEILHLAPSKIGGVNICANASPVCIDLCLNTSGRGQMTTVQKSRLNKKYYFLADRLKFLNHLDKEIKLSYKRAKRKKLKYTVRLNGTSDLPFERYRLENGLNLMDNNPHVQFVDYTKVTNRLNKKNKIPKNYDLTYSQAENNLEEVEFYYHDSIVERVKIWGNPRYFEVIMNTLFKCIKVSQGLFTYGLIIPALFSIILLIWCSNNEN